MEFKVKQEIEGFFLNKEFAWLPTYCKDSKSKIWLEYTYNLYHKWISLNKMKIYVEYCGSYKNDPGPVSLVKRINFSLGEY